MVNFQNLQFLRIKVMNIWIIIMLVIILSLSIEPIGLMLIRKKEIIYPMDIRELIYHYGDNVTKYYLITDEDDNIFLSEKPIPLFDNVEITYKGFSIPTLGIIPRIVSCKVIYQEV